LCAFEGRAEENPMTVRRRIAFSILCASAWLLPSLAAAQRVTEEKLVNPDLVSPFARVAESVMPSVASIRTVSAFDHPQVGGDFDRFFRGQGDMDRPGAGSGFVIEAEGYILTNNHVIDGADEVSVVIYGIDEEFEAEVVGQDPGTDLAVLKIDPKGHSLAAVSFADSDRLKVGDWAVAIGNPLGELASSLTVGVISAKGRSDLVIQGANLLYQDFLQTDAAINFGNSGGPLLDIHGRVIGVNTAINAAGQNIGFTIPSNLAVRIAAQLREQGRVVRGYLGVVMQDLSADLAEGRDLSIDYGVLVEEVRPNTPAERSGIERGDVIVRVGDAEIRDSDDLRFKIADSPVGEAVAVEVHREGRNVELDIVLAERPSDDLLARSEGGDVSTDDLETWLGMAVAGLDANDPRVDELIAAFDIRDDRGVIVVDVEPGSPADEARVRPGDVIFEVVTRAIDDVGDFEGARRYYQERTKPIALGIRRGEVTSYISVDPLAD
jgi:Do/DeqQ family serine protease